jgi:uroporphyrinogen-III synthase
VIVWMTRDEKSDGPLSQALTQAGLQIIHAPVLRRSIVSSALDHLPEFGSADWLLLTSPFAVKAIPERLGCNMQLAVVGESSRRLAEARGFPVALVSLNHDAASLFTELQSRVDRGRVLYPRSALAMPPKQWGDVELICPVFYTTERCEYDRKVVDQTEVAAVTSASAAEAIATVDVKFASIGPSTSKALRSAGKEPWIEAPQRTFTSLAQAIAGQTKP